MDQVAKWRSLFYHSMALHCDNADETGEATVKHDSINFRTDTAEPDPVTSIQVSGQILVTGHETGSVCFWTQSGDSLDCIPADVGDEPRDYIL